MDSSDVTLKNSQAPTPPGVAGRWTWIALGVAGFVVAVLLDSWAYERVFKIVNQDADRFRILRLAGYLPLWIVLGVVHVVHDWPRQIQDGVMAALRRGLMILAGAALTGAAAEVLKPLIRRDRPPRAPLPWDGVHTFDWSNVHTLQDFLSTADGHGLPSSHAAVAFGGAWMLTRLYPESKYIWLLFAAGCGLSRMIDHGHFLSDVYASALLGYIVCLGIVGAKRSAISIQ